MIRVFLNEGSINGHYWRVYRLIVGPESVYHMEMEPGALGREIGWDVVRIEHAGHDSWEDMSAEQIYRWIKRADSHAIEIKDRHHVRRLIHLLRKKLREGFPVHEY